MVVVHNVAVPFYSAVMTGKCQVFTFHSLQFEVCMFRLPVQNVPVDVKFPRECNKGLWGGEGFIIGYIKKKPRSQRSVNSLSCLTLH